MNTEHPQAESDEDRQERSDERRESGSGEDGGTSVPLPFAPDKDDDSPLGDTDQHSDA